MIELLKIRTARAIKRAPKLAKKWLGTFLRGNVKRKELLEGVIAIPQKGQCKGERPECAREGAY